MHVFFSCNNDILEGAGWSVYSVSPVDGRIEDAVKDNAGDKCISPLVLAKVLFELASYIV